MVCPGSITSYQSSLSMGGGRHHPPNASQESQFFYSQSEGNVGIQATGSPEPLPPRRKGIEERRMACVIKDFQPRPIGSALIIILAGGRNMGVAIHGNPKLGS